MSVGKDRARKRERERESKVNVKCCSLSRFASCSASVSEGTKNELPFVRACVSAVRLAVYP